MTSQPPPVTPADYERLTPWFNVIRQASSIIVCGAPQIVSITVLVGEDGKPHMWTGPERERLYPRGRSLLEP